MCLRYAATILVCSFVVSVTSWGATFRVPSDYVTIQEGLDESSPGDTVLVAPGTYNQATTRTYGVPTTSIAFIASGVALRSEAGSEHTTLLLDRVGASVGRVVYAQGMSTPSVIEGFTLDALDGYGGASVQYSAALTFRDCVFRDFGGAPGARGIAATLSDLRVENCTFDHCVAAVGSAIWQLEAHIWIENSVFRNCSDRAIQLSGYPSSG
jgi:hypothetical protein